MSNKNILQKIRRIKNKILLVSELGGCCQICGNDDFIHLCFHHVDKEKEFRISEKSSCSFDMILKEAKKCQLLCQNCHRELHFSEKSNINDKRRNDKIIYLEYAGAKCVKCGYNKCASGLTFHHRDPNEKTFSIGSLSERLNSIHELNNIIKNEIKKCEVLCSNCHVSEHFDMNFYIENIDLIKNYKIKKISKKIDREIVFEWHKEGLTNKEISLRLGCARSTISDILRGRVK